MTQKDSEDHSRPGEPREPADIDPASEPESIQAPPALDETTLAPAEPDVQPADSEPLLIEPASPDELILQASSVETAAQFEPELGEDVNAQPAPIVTEEPAQSWSEPINYVAGLAPEITPRGWAATPSLEPAESPSTSIEDAVVYEPADREPDKDVTQEIEAEPQSQFEPAPEPDQPAQYQQPPEPEPEPNVAAEPEPELPAPAPAASVPEPTPQHAPDAVEPAPASDPIVHQEARWQAPPVNAVFQDAPARHDRFEHHDAAEPEDRWDRAKEIARTGLRYAGYGIAGYFAIVFVLILLYRFINPPASTLMVAQALTGTDVRQDWVSLDEISPALVRAVIVSEDWTFCEHYGIDIKAIEQAIERSGNGIPRGASTISMQTTKNLFLWNAKSYIRKIIELPLTLAIELVWPKHRILEIYLNVAEWGPGIFGAEAAAQYHFNKPASRLGEREAAQLAASLPNPIIREAGDPGPRTARKASVIQSRMRNAGDAAKCVLGSRG